MLNTQTSQSVNIPELGVRIREAFKGAKNVQIARCLGISEPAVKNYLSGRATLPILLEISRQTGVSVHWLATGEGLKELKPLKNVSFDKLLEKRITQIVRAELKKYVSGELSFADEDDETKLLLELEMQEENTLSGRHEKS